MKIADKVHLYSWGAMQAIRLGRPEISLGFLGGIGDDLLCTAAIEEWLKRGARRIWFFTRYPELYSHYDRRVRLVPEDGRYRRLAEVFGRPMRPMNYSTRDPRNPLHDILPPHHIIVEMCRAAGLTGEITLRPHLKISDPERAAGTLFPRQIAIQSTCLNAKVSYPTKEWGAERFVAVANRLKADGQKTEEDIRLVQVGDRRDPLLPVDADWRGRPLREVAGLLAASEAFVGLEGFLAHFARAVDCPAVVVMGGRSRPRVFGYGGNENLYREVDCSPCDLRDGCPNQLKCLAEITPDDVAQATWRLLKRKVGRPMPAEVFSL